MYQPEARIEEVYILAEEERERETKARDDAGDRKTYEEKRRQRKETF